MFKRELLKLAKENRIWDIRIVITNYLNRRSSKIIEWRGCVLSKEMNELLHIIYNYKVLLVQIYRNVNINFHELIIYLEVKDE